MSRRRSPRCSDAIPRVLRSGPEDTRGRFREVSRDGFEGASGAAGCLKNGFSSRKRRHFFCLYRIPPTVLTPLVLLAALFPGRPPFGRLQRRGPADVRFVALYRLLFITVSPAAYSLRETGPRGRTRICVKEEEGVKPRTLWICETSPLPDGADRDAAVFERVLRYLREREEQEPIAQKSGQTLCNPFPKEAPRW